MTSASRILEELRCPSIPCSPCAVFAFASMHFRGADAWHKASHFNFSLRYHSNNVAVISAFVFWNDLKLTLASNQRHGFILAGVFVNRLRAIVSTQGK